MRFFASLLLLLSLGLSACMSSLGPINEPPRPQPIQPDAGSALIHFSREASFYGAMSTISVYEDGNRIGSLGNGSRFSYKATPGTHSYSAGAGSATVTLNCEPGQVYTLQVGIMQGSLFASGVPTLWVPGQGGPSTAPQQNQPESSPQPHAEPYNQPAPESYPPSSEKPIYGRDI